jgi:curved DNA-binding protein CbpA
VLAGYYANLEIPYGSDLSAVRSAWKQMMKRYHPDLHGEDPEKRQVASELTAELTRAYQELAKVLEQDGNR